MCGVSRNAEVAGGSVQRLSSCHDHPIQRCEALQGNLPAKRDSGVLFCSIAELHRGEMLGYGSEAISDVIPIQFERLAAGIDASERNVDVGMFRVEVRYRYPFERRMQVGSHPAHHIPRQSLQVETLAEFGRDYQLPHPWIGAILPLAKSGGNIDTNRFRAEPRLLRFERGTLPGDVSAVCVPLPCNPIARIAHPDRTMLKMGRSRPCRLLSPPSPRTSGVFHHRLEGDGQGGR